MEAKTDKKEQKKEKKTLRGKVKNMTPAAPMICALAGLVVLLPLRIWQLSSNTDMNTGFFVERNIFVYLFFIIIVGVSFATLILSYLCGKMPSDKQANVHRPLTGIASLAMAVGFGYESMKLLGDLQKACMETGLGLYETCVVNGTVLSFLEMAFGLVTVFGFVLYALACFTGKYTWLRFPAILFLAAPLWGFCRVVSYFTITTSYLVNAELFCELYAAVFVMLFLFYFARLVTGTVNEPITWLVVGMGLVSAILCLLASVPRIFTGILGLGTVTDLGVDGIYLACCFFAIVMVITTVTKGIAVTTELDELPETAGEDGDIPVEPFTVE